MLRLKLYAAMFAVIIGLLTTFNQTAQAQIFPPPPPPPPPPCITNPVVVNNSNSDVGSLRWANNNACAGSTITFNIPLDDVILLTNQIPISKNMTIQGPGVNLLNIHSAVARQPRNIQNDRNQYRIFSVAPGVTLYTFRISLFRAERFIP